MMRDLGYQAESWIFDCHSGQNQKEKIRSGAIYLGYSIPGHGQELCTTEETHSSLQCPTINSETSKKA